MIRVRCEMRLALTRPDAPMPPAVLGGELRVRSDEREGVVLAAAIPVALCDSAGVSPAATPLFRAPPLAMRRCDAGVNAAAALADEPAPAATSDSAPPLLVPEEDAGFAPFLPAEDRASLATRNAESFESLKQHGELHTVMDLVRKILAAAACALEHRLTCESAGASQLLSNTPDAFFAEEGTVYTYVSPGALKMLGYDRKEELLGCVMLGSLLLHCLH